MTRHARLLVLAAALVACGEKKVEDPRVEFSDVGFTLVLPLTMQHALDSLAPGLRMVRPYEYRADVREAAAEGGAHQALFAAVGDFDGDGKQDAVVEGAKPGETALIVIAIMNGAKPRAVEVARFPEYDASAVGVYLSRPVRPMPGAFEVVNYPDASTLYFYRDGAFEGVKTGG